MHTDAIDIGSFIYFFVRLFVVSQNGLKKAVQKLDVKYLAKAIAFCESINYETKQVRGANVVTNQGGMGGCRT